jgi:peptide/nickel transport system permease protein
VHNRVLIFVATRLLGLGVLLVLISFVVFSLLYLSPGEPLDALVGPLGAEPETIRLLRKEYHLDEPFLTQYWIWAKDAVQFQLGDSIQSTLPVSDEIKRRLPVSLFLGLYAYVVVMAVGLTLGVVAALRKGSIIDRGIVAGAVVGLSTPAFVSSVFILYVFAVVLPWFPPFGGGVGFVDRLWHLTLPAIALALVGVAVVVKHTRSALIKVWDEDYVTFARARGLSSFRILFLYKLRNALIPVVTLSAPLLVFMIGGALFVEVTFTLPGLGELLVQSATAKDIPLLQGTALLISVFILVANLVADLLYFALDPRIRLGRRAE